MARRASTTTTSSGGRGRPTAASLARRSNRSALAAARVMRDVGEMGQAAATTIALRTTGAIADAMRDPRLLADPELTLMVTEKVQAAAAAATAVAPKLALLTLHATRWMDAQAALAARGMRQLGAPTSAVAFWQGWLRLAEGAALANAAYGAAMVGTMVEMGRAALAPVHRAATANARRLGKR
jgi:hypothetical protein